MKKLFLLVITIGMASCLSQYRPQYILYESYQISNISSFDATISFFEKGSPKTVYAEIWEGGFATNLVTAKSSKACTGLWSGSQMELHPGQTALLYAGAHFPRNDSTLQQYANCLYVCGRSDVRLHLFSNLAYCAGDSATVSIDGTKAVSMPMDGGEWETWYDEQNWLYYHLLKVE